MERGLHRGRLPGILRCVVCCLPSVSLYSISTDLARVTAHGVDRELTDSASFAAATCADMMLLYCYLAATRTGAISARRARWTWNLLMVMLPYRVMALSSPQEKGVTSAFAAGAGICVLGLHSVDVAEGAYL